MPKVICRQETVCWLLLRRRSWPDWATDFWLAGHSLVELWGSKSTNVTGESCLVCIKTCSLVQPLVWLSLKVAMSVPQLPDERDQHDRLNFQSLSLLSHILILLYYLFWLISLMVSVCVFSHPFKLYKYKVTILFCTLLMPSPFTWLFILVGLDSLENCVLNYSDCLANSSVLLLQPDSFFYYL